VVILFSKPLALDLWSWILPNHQFVPYCLIARSLISSRKEVTEACGVVLDTINKWSSKRYNHLSYMHNEERKLIHITILVMSVARVYYVERGT